jgi:predicted ester cyclase
MNSMKETAKKLFHACESGEGWEVCQQFCTPDATFSAQADALAEMKTLKAYADWMKSVYIFAPDASYEIKSFGVDEECNNISGYGIFRATHTHEGGPVPPTGKSIECDYAFFMQFKDNKVRHMTKIWNDVLSYRQFGWDKD